MSGTLTTIPSAISDLPPASKLVYMYLVSNGEATLPELREVTQCAKSTLSNAVNQLVESGYATKQPNPEDRRQILVVFDPRE